MVLTIEKKLARDQFLKQKVLDILPLFSGCDFEEINNILDALKFVLRKNSIFDSENSARHINAYLMDLNDEA